MFYVDGKDGLIVIKVAMVGLGGMGSTHYNLYRKMDDVELVAVVDVEREGGGGKDGGERRPLVYGHSLHAGC